MDLAILVVRLIVGLGLAAHGAQKLFGWFGGYGLQGTGGFMEQIGFRPGKLFALSAGVAELGGGLLVALGLLGPLGPALVLLTMTVAIVAAHLGHGFFASNNGPELPLLYAAAAAGIAFAGYGAWSLDSLLGLAAWSATQVTATLGIALLVAVANLLVRRTQALRPQPAGH